MTPFQLIAKLAAIVPQPRKNLIHYHGVFAPAAPGRADIVPRRPSPIPRPTLLPPGALPPRAKSSSWIPWATLLHRVFGANAFAPPLRNSEGGPRRRAGGVGDGPRAREPGQTVAPTSARTRTRTTTRRLTRRGATPRVPRAFVRVNWSETAKTVAQRAFEDGAVSRESVTAGRPTVDRVQIGRADGSMSWRVVADEGGKGACPTCPLRRPRGLSFVAEETEA